MKILSEDFSYMVFCYKILEKASTEPGQKWPDYDPRPKPSLVHLLTLSGVAFPATMAQSWVVAENIYYITLYRKKEPTGKIALDNGMDIRWIEVFTTGTFSRFYIIIVWDSLDCIQDFPWSVPLSYYPNTYYPVLCRTAFPKHTVHIHTWILIARQQGYKVY